MHDFLQARRPAGAKPTPFTEMIRTRRQKSAVAHLSTPSRREKSATISVDQAKRLAKYAPQIQRAARKYNVPIELVCGVILQESGGNARAVSPAGAKGLMQLMPATAKRMGVKNAFDAGQNIDGGVNYLRELLDRFDGDVRLALAGYNAGEANVEKHGGVPPFSETRAYIPKVLAYTRSIQTILASAATTLPAAEPLPPTARRV